MKTILYYLTIILLLLTGISALIGGYLLISDPTGDSIQLSSHFLQTTPFPDYTIPGCILFISVGVFGVLVAGVQAKKGRLGPRLLFYYGVVVVGWIICQMILIQYIFVLQFVIGGLGIFFMAAGRREQSKVSA